MFLRVNNLCLALLAVCVSGCHVSSLYEIPPGREEIVLHYIEPLKMGDAVADGYHLENVEIDHETVRLEFETKDGTSKTSAILSRRWAAKTGVDVRCGVAMPESICERVRQVVAASTATSPWVRKALSRPSFDLVLILVGLALLIVLTIWLLMRIKRPGAVQLVLLGALTALAFVLRLTLSPRTFLHEYFHIAETMNVIFDSPDGSLWGMTGPAILRIADWTLGGQEHAVFLANAIAASLTIPALVLFDLALFGRWTRALLAGTLLCLLPTHLRLSASEDFYVVGVLFSCWSLAAWAYWLKSRDTLALMVSLLALWLAMNSRAELMLLPIAHAGLAIATLRRDQWRAVLLNHWLLIGGVVMVALFAHRALQLRSLYEPIRAAVTHPPGSAHVLLLNPGATPLWIVVLVVLGLVWGFRERPRETLWLAAFASYAFLPFMAFGNAPSLYRHQMLSMALFCMLAAGAPMLFRRAAVSAGVIVLLAALSLWIRRPFVTELFDQQQEFAFLAETVPQLPEDAEVIAQQIPGADRWDVFPQFLLTREHPQARVDDLLGTGTSKPWPAPKPGLYFYQGMNCFVSATTPPDPMAESCLRIRAHYQLRPAFVRMINARNYSDMKYAPPPYEIGFFEVVAVK